jgi:hypothetical protein
MSVEFDEEQPLYMSRPVAPKKVSLLVRITYVMGLAHDESEAQKIMGIAALSFFALAVGIFVFANLNSFTAKRIVPDPSDSIYQQQLSSHTAK